MLIAGYELQLKNEKKVEIKKPNVEKSSKYHLENSGYWIDHTEKN